MTDEARFAHLKRLCSAERSALALPFLVTHDGESWSIATDGKMLFAWRGKLGGVEERNDAPKIPHEWIAKALLASGATTAEALRAWAGAATFPSMQDCTACGGTGTAIEHHTCNCEYCEADDETTVDCADCDGVKKVMTDDVRPGVIGGTGVDRNFFAMLLDGVDGSVCVDPGDGEYAQVRMHGDDWFAIVMPRKLQPAEREQSPALAI